LIGLDGFRAGVVLRAGWLFGTVVAAAWLAMRTDWLVAAALCVLLALAQLYALIHYASRSGREVARFLDAVAFEDLSQSFTALARDTAHGELGAAMTRVLDRLRESRSGREEQARRLQAVLAHIPVALLAIDGEGRVHLLNLAARRLFELATDVDLARHGEGFAAAIESLLPGNSVIVRMERQSGALTLKAAASDFVVGGVRTRLLSLQNIGGELSAQELDAWQNVVGVMAHEVMNSLTPIASLSATARDRVCQAVAELPSDDARRPGLADAAEALETLTRRSEGLLHFVQAQRRLTRRFAAKMESIPVLRTFVRLERLLAGEFAARDIALEIRVEPQTLEIAADPELLDQALINLVRNAIEALAGEAAGQIALTAQRDQDGHTVLCVADNGPGIPAELRRKVFIPFFTTKRQGSGVGLTLVRQIAAVHGATVDIHDRPGGGAIVALRF